MFNQRNSTTTMRNVQFPLNRTTSKSQGTQTEDMNEVFPHGPQLQPALVNDPMHYNQFYPNYLNWPPPHPLYWHNYSDGRPMYPTFEPWYQNYLWSQYVSGNKCPPQFQQVASHTSCHVNRNPETVPKQNWEDIEKLCADREEMLRITKKAEMKKRRDLEEEHFRITQRLRKLASTLRDYEEMNQYPESRYYSNVDNAAGEDIRYIQKPVDKSVASPQHMSNTVLPSQEKHTCNDTNSSGDSTVNRSKRFGKSISSLKFEQPPVERNCKLLKLMHNDKRLSTNAIQYRSFCN